MTDGQFDFEDEDAEITAAEAALAEAQRRVEELRQRNRPKVLEEIKKKIRLYDFTADELGLTAYIMPSVPKTAGLPKTGVSPSKAVDGRSIVKPKYIGPAGQTWSGRGRDPSWLTLEIQQGRAREEFLAPTDASN